MGKRWWLVFGSFQLVGFAIAGFSNVHGDIAFLLSGMFLLLPGSAVVGFVPLIDIVGFWPLCLVIVIVNFVTWATITLLLVRLQRGTEPE
jgi:hypothetical protein